MLQKYSAYAQMPKFGALRGQQKYSKYVSQPEGEHLTGLYVFKKYSASHSELNEVHHVLFIVSEGLAEAPHVPLPGVVHLI